MPVDFSLDVAPVDLETTSLGEGVEVIVSVAEVPEEFGGEAVLSSCGVESGLSTPSPVLHLTGPLPQVVEGGGLRFVKVGGKF